MKLAEFSTKDYLEQTGRATPLLYKTELEADFFDKILGT